MTAGRPTMSALPRAAVCPASVVLPQTDYASEYSDGGNDRHAVMEAAVINREHDKLPPQVAQLLAEYDADRIYPELTLFYDWVNDAGRSSEKRTNRVDRYASATAYEIPGTSDVVAIDVKRRRGLVIDWKGWEEVGGAAINLQTSGYAIALARLFDLDEVTVAIAYLGEGKQYVDVAALDEVDFDAFRIQIKALNGRIAAARREPLKHMKVSRHCRWCSAFFDCAAQKALEIDLGDDKEIARIEGMIPFDNDELAAKAYDFVAKARVLLKRTSDALYARASQRPIPLSNGKWFGRVEKRGNLELVADVVYDVVRAKHGQVIADKAVERVATQTRLEAALKETGPKSLAAEKKAILDTVEKLNGSSRTPKSSIEECDQSKLAGPREVSPEAIEAADKLLAANG